MIVTKVAVRVLETVALDVRDEFTEIALAHPLGVFAIEPD